MYTYKVYLFFDENDDVIYVGKTERDIDKRMNEHFGPYGHLPKSILSDVRSIKYYEFLTKHNMDMAEAHLIKKYKNTCRNRKKEYISKNERQKIEKEISKMNLIIYREMEKCKCLEQSQQQRIPIKIRLRMAFLKLKNTLRDFLLAS